MNAFFPGIPAVCHQPLNTDLILRIYIQQIPADFPAALIEKRRLHDNQFRTAFADLAFDLIPCEWMDQGVDPSECLRVFKDLLRKPFAVQRTICLQDTVSKQAYQSGKPRLPGLFQLPGHKICLDHLRTVFLRKQFKDPAFTGSYSAGEAKYHHISCPSSLSF